MNVATLIYKSAGCDGGKRFGADYMWRRVLALRKTGIEASKMLTRVMDVISFRPMRAQYHFGDAGRNEWVDIVCPWGEGTWNVYEGTWQVYEGG